MGDAEGLIAYMDEVYRTARKVAESFELGAKNDVDALEKILTSPWVSNDYKATFREDAKRIYRHAKKKIERLIPKRLFEKIDDPEVTAVQSESLRNYELKAKRIEQLALAGE